MTDAYLAQVEHQRDQARRDLRSAEDELAQLRPLPAQLATAKAELAKLHEGEEPYENEHLVATPAQWIWMWNRSTPARRLDVAGQIRSLSDVVDRCTFGLHEQRIAELRELRQGWTAKVAELAAAERINASQMARLGQLADVEDRLHEAEARIAAVRVVLDRVFGCASHETAGLRAEIREALEGAAL